MMTTTSISAPAPAPASSRLRLTRCAWLPLLLLAALAAPQAQGFDFINITQVVPTAQESPVAANIRDGVVAISRTGDTTVPLLVNFSVASDDVSYISYTVSSSGILTYLYANTGTAVGMGPGTGTVTIPAGVAVVTLSIAPIDDQAVRGGELVNIIIAPAATYQFNGNAEASVVIAEGDLTLVASLPVSVAYKQALPGFAFDVDSSRRGVISATFNTPTLENVSTAFPFPNAGLGNLALFPNVPAAVEKFLGVQFSGTGVVTTDYNLTYKITGISPVATTPLTVPLSGNPVYTNAWSLEAPGPAFGTPHAGATGVGYNVVSYLRGYNQGAGAGSTNQGISILTPAANPLATGQTTIKTNDFITFSDNPTIVYQATLANGLLYVAFPNNSSPTNYGLQANLHNGATISDVGQTQVVGYAVDAPYSTGATVLNVENGFNGFHYGDVFQISQNTPNDLAFYVVTGFQFNTYLITPTVSVTNGDGTLSLTPYLNVSTPGLNVAIGGAKQPITTEFPLSLSANGETGSLILPDRSSQIQFAVTPIHSGTPTGMRTVSAQLIGNTGFNLVNPAQATVEIADDAVTANINNLTDATSPNVGGSFLVTFTNSFPVPITVPYTVIAGPGTPAVIGTDYTISGLTAIPAAPTTGFGSVVLPVGAKSVVIPVTPISTLVAPETVTISLSPSLDYLLASGTTTTINPTATVNILPSLGTIGVTNTTPAATTPVR